MSEETDAGGKNYGEGMMGLNFFTCFLGGKAGRKGRGEQAVYCPEKNY